MKAIFINAFWLQICLRWSLLKKACTTSTLAFSRYPALRAFLPNRVYKDGLKYALLFVACFLSVALQAANPVATDTRVRTYVYGESEVFKVVTQYGFQSSIEFSAGEEILTLSVGDAVSWRVTPAGNRLFIQSLREEALTNMTVVTNKYTYNFDLSSRVSRSEDITYLVRFYYPAKDFDNENAVLFGDGKYNFNYSLIVTDESDSDITPVKVFDDGRSTFFQFPTENKGVPNFFMNTPDGKQVPVNYRDEGAFVVVGRVAPKFTLRRGNSAVSVVNDRSTGVPPTTSNRQF